MSWDGRPARLEIAFDVTDRKRESEAFKFLADAGAMVVDCIRVLEGEHVWEAALNDVLRILGTFLEADRAYVFMREDDCMVRTHEWRSLGVALQKPLMQNVPRNLADEWIERFTVGDAVIIEDVEALLQAQRTDEYEVLKSRGIFSLVSVPLEVDGAFVGYLGVDNPRRVGDLTFVKAPLVAFAGFVSCLLYTSARCAWCARSARPRRRRSRKGPPVDINEFKRAFFDVACDMQKLLHDLVAPACQRNGLTLQQMHVLVELVSAPGQTSTQLSERAGILRTNFSSVCHKLEERGLVERRRSDRDRRAFELRATDEGRELLARIDADIRRCYGPAFENEPPETFDAILAGFRALNSFAAKLER